MVRKANCLCTEISSVISVSISQWCAHRSLAHDISIHMGCLCMFACLFCMWNSEGLKGKCYISKFISMEICKNILWLTIVDIKEMFGITIGVKYKQVLLQIIFVCQWSMGVWAVVVWDTQLYDMYLMS